MEITDIFTLDNYQEALNLLSNVRGYTINEITKEGDLERRFQFQEVNKTTTEEILQDLRYRRETECFSIINRGRLWYDTLTDWQQEELRKWYREWLDLPAKYQAELDIKTKYQVEFDIQIIIPKRPEWLK